jgi:SWI/SNF-related matrix-associated actin-dependent regulator of chromatin subfamily A member 5
MLQLRKICNHTYLLPDVAPEPYVVDEEIVGGSGKLMVSYNTFNICVLVPTVRDV